MKKSNLRRSCYILLLLVLTFGEGIGRTAAWGTEKAGRPLIENEQIRSDDSEAMSEMFKGKVVEIIDAGRQFYVRIDTGDRRIWVAVPTFNGHIGDMVIVPPGLPVADFQSRKINRKFDMIYFVGSLRRVDGGNGDKAVNPSD
jgi:hypothetical protein